MLTPAFQQEGSFASVNHLCCLRNGQCANPLDAAAHKDTRVCRLAQVSALSHLANQEIMYVD